MKNFLYILIASFTALSAILAPQKIYADKIEDLTQEMGSQAEIFVNWEDPRDFINAFDKMNELDFELKKEKCVQLLEKLDFETYTGNQLRDIGFLLYASDFKEQAKTVIYQGAAKGDPFCINFALVDLATDKQDPEIAVEFIELWLPNSTLPFYHNMALLCYHVKNKDIKKFGAQMAELFYKYIDDSGVSLEYYNPFEFLHYNINPTFRKINGAWRPHSDFKDIEKIFEYFYPRD